jgi:hypothetical protein
MEKMKAEYMVPCAPVCTQAGFFAAEPIHASLFIDETRSLTYKEKHEGVTDGKLNFRPAQRAGTTSSKSQYIAFSTDTSYRSGHPARSHTPQKPAV